jgi:K+ transporter
MILLLSSVVVYLGTFLVYWIALKVKKRSKKIIRFLSLVALCPIIISSIFIFDELVKIIEVGNYKILFQIVILFIMIYSFRIYQDFILKKTDNE